MRLQIVRAGVLAVALGCGGSGNEKKPDRPLTNQEVVNQMDEDLKRNMEEVDKDPSLSPKQKEETKAMMRETVKKRSEAYREQP